MRPSASSRGQVYKRRPPSPRHDKIPQKYKLRLFVTGARPNSVRAIRNVREICERHLKGRYTLEIVDLYQQRERAKGEQIVAAPTLVKELPAPLRKLIGDLSDEKTLLLALDLIPPP